MNEQFKADVIQTIRDVEIIRTLIQKTEHKKEWKQTLRPLAARLNYQFHLGVLLIATSLFFVEIFGDHYNTHILLYSGLDNKILILGIANMALLLVVMIAAFYFLMYRTAKKSSTTLREYIEEHFQYVANLSFLTDLFLKFALLSMILIARRPEWMAPVLTLYIGDYLFQGRFFVLPLRTALFTGTTCFCIAGWQLAFENPYLCWSLLVFILVCAASLYFVRSMAKEG